ncbi:hypothetical protein [Intrasporangium sp.]|uniref:hypothetical protein n=1 Tax=Intrasporangium sp. TaxID=1925024 RepID=UPI003221F8BB
MQHTARPAHAPGPVPGRPPSPQLVLSLQRAVGNHAVATLLGGPSVQRLVSKDDLWDHYFDAYSSRMRTRGRIDQRWTDVFFHFENRLYGAKAQVATVGDAAYDAAGVQDAHDNLAALGFAALPPSPDPNVAAARAVITVANTRWSAFRGNGGLNRGAWAGSATHGEQPPNYVQTAAGVIAELRNMQLAQAGRIGSWWLMASDTAPSGNALHRGGVDARGDFIYHL